MKTRVFLKYFVRGCIRVASSKILPDKAFDIAQKPNYDGYQRGLASMVNRFFDEKAPATLQINLLVVALKMRICLTRN